MSLKSNLKHLDVVKVDMCSAGVFVFEQQRRQLSAGRFTGEQFALGEHVCEGVPETVVLREGPGFQLHAGVQWAWGQKGRTRM